MKIMEVSQSEMLISKAEPCTARKVCARDASHVHASPSRLLPPVIGYPMHRLRLRQAQKEFTDPGVEPPTFRYWGLLLATGLPRPSEPREGHERRA